MNRTLQILTTSTLLASLAVISLFAGERQPNILVIISDDQGFAELGAYADFADPLTLQAKNIEELRQISEITEVEVPIEVALAAARKATPNLDWLAENGTRFTSFYAAPTCAPARGALMTARYPQRYGVYSNDDIEGRFGQGYPLEAKFLVEAFRRNGYETALIGKWHLGSRPGQHPNDRGFEYYFGFDRAHVDKYDSSMLWRNRENAEPEGWLEDQISNEAVAFLERAVDDPRPFFLYVAYNVPHGPIPPPPQEYMDHFNSGSKAVDVYFGTIFGMDVGIGRMLRQLEAMGELDNTLIMFGSDNGLARGVYHFGFEADYERERFFSPIPGNGPLRGCKWTPWDGGVRVPFIARLPGGLKGATSDSLQSIMDVLPTAMEYAGFLHADESPIDGNSFLSVLKEGEPVVDERILFWACDSQVPFPDRPEFSQLQRRMQAMGQTEIRSARHPSSWYVRTPEWKLVGWDAISPLLFNIRNDPGELNDLSGKYPEVVRSLSAQFAGWFSEQAKPLVYPMENWSNFKAVGSAEN
jgi:uncharacterized sulfatase